MESNKYNIEIPDINYYRKLIACQNACPVHTDARGFVNAIADGEFERGYISARQPNPFVSTCGRVCNAPCESSCRRGKIDSPVAIRPLKRFLTEKYGVERLMLLPSARKMDTKFGAGLIGGPSSENSGTIESFSVLERMSQSESRVKKGARVAIIGSGPAGLSAAQDLALLGYQVTVFEKANVTGGMLHLGLPEYRLPRDVVKCEIQQILDLGVDLKLGMELGKDFSLDGLFLIGYKAVFVAIGAHKSRELNIEGVKLDGVFRALDFLFNVNKGYRVQLGERVLVVGGGGVAVDAARTVARIDGGTYFHPENTEDKDVATALDVARQALRLGIREVHLICLESLDEMPASTEELDGAIEEGVILHTRVGPIRILGQQGKVEALETIRVQSVFDEKGKFNPTFIPGTESTFHGDTVIMAVGQTCDLSFIQPGDGVAVNRNGTITVNPETLATTRPGVFSGGDVAFGPRLIIEAIRDGHKVARSIDQYFQGKQGRVISHNSFTAIPPDKLPPTARLLVPRQKPPTQPLDRRIGVSEVELNYSEDVAREQANRCLRCHIQTVFNGNLCILCGGCVDVCPMSCLKLVRLNQIEGDPRLEALLSDVYGISPEVLIKEDVKDATALIKDETYCIRCGLCQRRCPTGAITLAAVNFEEEISYDSPTEKSQKALIEI